MNNNDEILIRIAEALERFAPRAAANHDWLHAPAYVWDGSARPVTRLVAPELGLLKGIDAQKDAVVSNVARLAAGYAAHDMLLWGSRGMGKSALLRAAVLSAQCDDSTRIALVQVAPEAISSLAALFGQLAGQGFSRRGRATRRLLLSS